MLRKNAILLLVFFGMAALLITAATADSPAVVVSPPSVPPGGTVTITLTASVANTVVSSISISGPAGNPGPWTWSGVPITMPDVGDSVSITFPGGVFTVVTDGDTDVTGGPGVWTAGANTGTTGSYFVTLTGTETDPITKSFTIVQEFNVPQFALGTTVVTAIGFAGLTLIRRRLKKA